MSAVLLRKTCFPIHLLPTNFFDILIGSQFNNLDKKVRNVVPSVKGKSPPLNSSISRCAYASSSAVHLPRRSGGPSFFLLLEAAFELLELELLELELFWVLELELLLEFPLALELERVLLPLALMLVLTLLFIRLFGIGGGGAGVI